jgi:hypothetical protein
MKKEDSEGGGAPSLLGFCSTINSPANSIAYAYINHTIFAALITE